MKKFALAAILFAIGNASASGADLPLRPFAPSYQAPAWSWTGFYIGASAGYGWSNGDHSVTVHALNVTTEASGFIGGIHAGYNWQFDQFVAGVETDIAWANITATAGLVGKVGLVPFAVQVEDTLRSLGTARVRLGFLLVQSVMLYGSAGVAYGSVENNVISSIGSSSIQSSFAQSFSASNTRLGWAIGAGTEWAITHNLLTRIEWLHYDLGSTSYAFPLTSSHSGNIVRTGLSYKF